MAGSLVIWNWNPGVMALLKEGVEAASRAANRDAAVMFYNDDVTNRENPIAVTYIMNGSMILRRLVDNFESLVRNGIRAVGFDVEAGPNAATGGVTSEAEYVLTSDKAAVKVRIYLDEETGKFKGFGVAVVWAEDIKGKTAKEALEPLIKWVEKNFNVNILKGVGEPRLTDLYVNNDIAKLYFELGE
ncbi:hypothetical protein JCM16307_23570 [Thermococcus prieurii]